MGKSTRQPDSVFIQKQNSSTYAIPSYIATVVKWTLELATGVKEESLPYNT